MSFSFILLNSLSVLTISCMIIIAWLRRSSTGSRELMVFSLFMLEWAIGSFVEEAVTALPLKIIIRDITQIGVFYTTAAVLMFSITYTGILYHYRKMIGWMIYVLQTCSIIFIMTDRWHHLARNNIYLIDNSLVVVTSMWDRILISFNLLYMVVSIFNVLAFVFIAKKSMKKQVLCVVLGMLIIVSYSLVKVSTDGLFGISVPISCIFALGCIFMLIGIMRYDLIMVTPIARNEAVNIMNDGVIIISASGNIIDANPAALRIFNRSNELSVENGTLSKLQDTLQMEYPELYDGLLKGKTQHFNIPVEICSETRYYFCECYAVRNKKNNVIGSFAVIKDITEQKIINIQLKLAAERDGLTGIYNRSTFINKAEELIRETNSELCMFFLDVDHFKQVNDRYGHAAGDLILMELCRHIEHQLPEDALFGRMGGEEFAVFFKVTDEQKIVQIAENIRYGMEKKQFCYKDDIINATISIGIAYGSNYDFNRLYNIADTNLYRAKQLGRNCLC